jgi:hypothetical protein
LVAVGLHVTVWHPAQANAELKGAADNTRLFNFKADHECFTLDGVESAFRIGGSSSGNIVRPRSDKSIAAGEYTYSGTFAGGTLSLWRLQGRLGQQVTMSAPGASTERAVQVFDFLHEWGIADLGTDWIATA